MSRKNVRGGKKGKGKLVRLSRATYERAERRAKGEEVNEKKDGKFVSNRKLFGVIKRAVQHSWPPISIIRLSPSRLSPTGLQQIVVADGENITASFLNVGADDLFNQRLQW